jgi:uncharacterized repeat protein (TIGR02543 family)
MAFDVTDSVNVTILTVGRRGSGGLGVGTPTGTDWYAGRRGGTGGETRVRVNGHDLRVFGGEGGGPYMERNNRSFDGGYGAPAVTRPSDIAASNWAQVSGNRGTNGRWDGGGAGTSSYGNGAGGAGQLLNTTGILSTFASRSGGRGGNNIGDNVQSGVDGGDGQVTILVIYYRTVTFNANGGSIIPAQELLNGTRATQPANPTRNGYTFAGWWTAQTGGSQWNFSNNITANTTLWARWTPIVYTISYNLDGGTNNSNNPPDYTIETPTFTLQPPTRSGFTFGGWFDNASFTGNPITSISVGSTGDSTFWAMWEQIPTPLSIIGVFSGDSVRAEARLQWRYNNLLNVTGRFYVYRRQTIPAPTGAWALLNSSGINASSGANRDGVYEDRTVAFGRTYEYRVVFVQGTATPSATTPPTANSASVSVEIVDSVGIRIPGPDLLVAAFNQRTERLGANGQIMLDWAYRNPHDVAGRFYVYRREAGSWSLLNPSGIDVATSSNVLSMAYADNSITFNRTYEYRIVFVEGTTAPSATTPPAANSADVSTNTHLPNATPGLNATVPFNRTSDTYVVDGVTYKDIYGMGERSLRDRDHEVFRHLLNGFQLAEGGDTHLSRWMDVGKLILPLDADVAGVFNGARNTLNTRRTSRPAAGAAISAGTLRSERSVAVAAAAMLAEFNGHNGYAIGNYESVNAVPPALSGLDEVKGPVFWVLDRHLVHGNNVNDDRNAGTTDYAYYGVGLIFHDLKLSYLETGDPFFSALSGITGIIDEPFTDFRYTFGDIGDAVVSGVRNLSGVIGTYEQSLVNHRKVTVDNGVSTLNGYTMSEMRGEETSYFVSYTVGETATETHELTWNANAKFPIKLVKVEAGSGGRHVWHAESSWEITEGEAGTFTSQLSTSEVFSRANSHNIVESSGDEVGHIIGVPLPPHTQVMLRQGRSSVEVHIGYDYPVVISYKVTVVALGSRRSGNTASSFMRPIATFGIDRASDNRASSLEVDAAENFRVLWGNRNVPGLNNNHSKDTISLNRIWTQMKQTTGTVSNFCLWGFENGLASVADATLESRFITPVTAGMTNVKPMTVVRGTMSKTFESMNSEIFEFQPIYALHRIEAPGFDAIDLLNGSQYFVDRIELTGRNIHGVDFYGFHKDKGSWVLTDAAGNLHDGSIARLVAETGTGRPTVVADNSATGTVFLRYLIRNDVYSYDGLNGYMTADDLGMRTAIIPINVRAAGALGIASQPQGGTMPVTAAATHPLTVEVVATGNVSYQWYINTEPSVVGGLPIPGATDPTYNAPLGTIGVFFYYVVVSVDSPEIEPVVSMLAMMVVEEEAVGVKTADRVIPDNVSNDIAVVAPLRALTAQFTAGPNPVSRASGEVNFFRQGTRVQDATLSVYDASGNIVNRIRITDRTLTAEPRRQVGSWNLTDRRGRPVAEGTYLVRGVVTTSDGKRERVSVVVGVR